MSQWLAPSHCWVQGQGDEGSQHVAFLGLTSPSTPGPCLTPKSSSPASSPLWPRPGPSPTAASHSHQTPLPQLFPCVEFPSSKLLFIPQDPAHISFLSVAALPSHPTRSLCPALAPQHTCSCSELLSHPAGIYESAPSPIRLLDSGLCGHWASVSCPRCPAWCLPKGEEHWICVC